MFRVPTSLACHHALLYMHLTSKWLKLLDKASSLLSCFDKWVHAWKIISICAIYFRGIWSGLQRISFARWRQSGYCNCGCKNTKRLMKIKILLHIFSMLFDFSCRILWQWYCEGYVEGMLQNEQVWSPKRSHPEWCLLRWRASPFHHHALYDKW